MKKSLLLVALLLALCPVLMAKNFTVTSPDGIIQITIDVNENITWFAEYNNTKVVEKVTIDLVLSNEVSDIIPRVRKINSRSIDEEILVSVPYKDAVIRDHCNELTLTFQNNEELIFRIYNDGVAYRFRKLGKEAFKVKDEIMQLTFPSNTTSHFPLEESMYSHNERNYLKLELTDLKENDFCSLPVLFKSAGKINVLFTETALHHYPCMFLKKGSSLTMESQFPKYVLEAIPNQASSPDRNQLITKEADYIASIKGAHDFPWRVFIISHDDRVLVESNLAYQLATPSQIAETSWIKPGKVAWDWYNANNIYGVDFESGINNETYQYYIDFAAKHGIEYVILDEGWTKSTTEILESNPDIDVETLVQYAAKKNVGIILWVLWKPLNDNMDEILETYARWGAKGIKVDFMQRSDQAMVESYENIAETCANLNLLVDYHGAFKPAGLQRTYPNVLNFEGVKGSENNKWSIDVTPEHNVTLPFIRMAAGPMDYTPGAMYNASLINHKISHFRPMSLGTRCHQIAMYVLYEAPLQMLCENPSTYLREEESVEFMAKIPTTWDETRVLEAAVGDYLVLARRKGTNWYLGAMTDWDARSFDIDLSFLPDGDFTMEVMKDGVNAEKFEQDYKREILKVNSNTKVSAKLASGGGWAAIVRPE
jgi:alpha-glucosidase